MEPVPRYEALLVATPCVSIVAGTEPNTALRLIEAAGRTSYLSKANPDSAAKFVAARIKDGHESILEHAGFSARFITDRAVQNEIVRHRLASYTVESTRFCDYAKGGTLQFIEPPFKEEDALEAWIYACAFAANAYEKLREIGEPPELARSVLPMCLKSEVVMTANMREWRHFFKLRCAPDAHPQLRELALDLLDQAKDRYPVIFDDIKPKK